MGFATDGHETMRIASGTGFVIAFLLLLPASQVLTAAGLKSQTEVHVNDLSYQVSFESESSEMGEAERARAGAFGKRLAHLLDLRLAITGFAAQTGNRLQDRHLALARARELRKALVDAGFPKERTLIQAKVVAPGAGETESETAPEGPLSPHRAEVRPYAP
jgi:outer membrane protein OmpA-like peptidoglycan-associated protein